MNFEIGCKQIGYNSVQLSYCHSNANTGTCARRSSFIGPHLVERPIERAT